MGELDCFLGQATDRFPFCSLNVLFVDKPGSAKSGDRFQGQVRAHIVRLQSAGGNEADAGVAVGAFEGFEIIGSTRLFRREELLNGATQRKTFLNLTGGDDSGNKGEFCFLGGMDDFFIQPRS